MTDQPELYLTQSLSNNNGTTYEEITNDDYGSTTFKPFAKEDYIENFNDFMDIDFSKNFNEISLQQLKERIDMTEHESKSSSLVYVMQNTDLVNDDHLLGFLCIEKFDVDLALKRLLRYWTNRHKLFGDKYSQPLTLNGAMSDRIDDIRKGFMILLPVLDKNGRAIIYVNPALFGGDGVDEVLQVWWFLVHVASENPSVRKNGFIMLGNIKDCRLRHFNSKRVLAMIRAGTYYFPVLGKECHLCNPMAVFPFVAPVLKAMLSIRLRQTLTVHRGPTDKVLKSLAACSIPSTCLPTYMGGTLDVSSSFIEGFIATRLNVEEGGHRMSDITSTSPLMRLVSDSSTSTPARAKAAGERKTKHKKVPGRSGDERMNKAVLARKHDPNISLMQALLLGGFVFPEMYTPGVKMAQVKDTDGVTIAQRKNQLNRRLRLDKKNQTK